MVSSLFKLCLLLLIAFVRVRSTELCDKTMCLACEGGTSDMPVPIGCFMTASHNDLDTLKAGLNVCYCTCSGVKKPCGLVANDDAAGSDHDRDNESQKTTSHQ